MKLSIDDLYDSLIGMFLSGGTQAGGSIVNAARTNTNTRAVATAEADYVPYVEQLKQAQWNKKVRDLQSAYQQFLQLEQKSGVEYHQSELNKIEKVMPDTKDDGILTYADFDKEHLAQREQELLPDHQKAQIAEKKLSGYALNMNIVTGKDKAIAFQKALGYNIDNQDLLIEQIRRGLARYRATSRIPNQYGVPFEVSMVILGTNGRYAKVKTAWIIDHGATDPRLVTLYIDK